jgi:hypothetical protein
MFGKLTGKLEETLKNSQAVKDTLAKYTGANSSAPSHSAPSHSAQAYPATNSSGQNRKALLIGINYVGQKGELKGCWNDVKNVHSYISRKGFNNVRVVTDEPTSSMKPTRQNIIDSLKWLVAGAQPGDSLFFHYSGHGSSQKDNQGDENDGHDETLVPLDYLSSGMIIDDELHSIVVLPLKKGVRLTCIFDCCHSGSGLDLPYTYSLDGSTNNVVIRDNRAAAVKAGLAAGKAFLRKDHQAAMREAFKAFSLLTSEQGSNNARATPDEKSSEADILFVLCF